VGCLQQGSFVPLPIAWITTLAAVPRRVQENIRHLALPVREKKSVLVFKYINLVNRIAWNSLDFKFI